MTHLRRNLYPAIINNEDDNYLVNIYEKLDCWDRSKSNYEQEDHPGWSPHVIISFDVEVLDKIKESDRLIFKNGRMTYLLLWENKRK